MAAFEVLLLDNVTVQADGLYQARSANAGDTYEMPADVNITGDLTVTGTFPAPEGTAVLSTGEGGGSKFLRENGDNTCSWQVPAGGGDLLADGTTPLTGGWDVGAFTITALTFVSDQATGTAPFTVASTTQVANLNAATAGNAATVTTNANLTGHVTSTGNAAILGSFTSAQLNTAISDATLTGNNTGDQTNITGNAATVTTNANLTGHVTSTGNAAILGSFTVAQLSTALSDATISGNNSGDQTITGKQTMWVPAGAMRPTVSNGCAALTDVETTAGRPDMTVLDFDAAADEHAQFQVAFPKQWALGTVTFQAFWTTTATGTTGVAFGLQGVAASDADTIDVVYGTAVVVTDDAQTAAEDMYVTAESGAVTIAGTPADDDACFFRIFRDVSDANDDMTEDARLIGIKIFYTTDAATDA